MKNITFWSYFLDSRKYFAVLSENVPKFAKNMIFFKKFYFCNETLMSPSFRVTKYPVLLQIFQQFILFCSPKF